VQLIQAPRRILTSLRKLSPLQILSPLRLADDVNAHGLTSAQYQAEFNAAHEAGLSTQAVSGYDGASTHRYIAFWREQPRAPHVNHPCNRARVGCARAAAARRTLGCSSSEANAGNAGVGALCADRGEVL
jgi:hypothetical protein